MELYVLFVFLFEECLYPKPLCAIFDYWYRIICFLRKQFSSLSVTREHVLKRQSLFSRGASSKKSSESDCLFSPLGIKIPLILSDSITI